ncbi:DUF790 family protein [Methanosarcina sp. Mfa9]|uniref:DUF790 family protein n=1 Tax=Methanosarcina sp. Mfa9 TaxID=3439063 RepID=UPI003F87EB3C
MNNLLTSDLLVTRISYGKIKPTYASFDSENFELAKLLIETFEQHVGKPYGDLLSELEGLEEMNYRFIRGLAQLLGRRTVIETDAAVDPTFAREAVFEACGGMALSTLEREAALEKAAEKFKVSVPELEEALWADLEENQVLKSFEPISPAELLRKYNISLTQTLLFKAVDMDIRITGDYQKILWRILKTGLMYTLEDEGETEEQKEGVHLHLDGPASLFKMSERYGNSFARLFPVLLRSGNWELKAGILHKGYQGKRLLEFALDSSEKAFKPPLPKGPEYPETKTGPESEYESSASETRIGEARAGYETRTVIGMPKKGMETPEKESIIYDSAVEKIFGGLKLGSWEIRREPTVLKAGKYAFVPDFALERDGTVVYLEIVGFWTSEYLKKKIGKLKEVREPVILLINRKLKCSEKDFPAQDVIFYEKKIPVNEVMQILRRYEAEKRAEDRAKVQDSEIPLTGEIISLEAISKEKGIGTDALKDVLSKRLEGSEESKGSEEPKESEISEESEKSEEYVLLENYVLHRNLLEKVDRELEKLENSGTYADAVKVFEGFGLDRSLYYPVLEELGYKVSWVGLSEDDAKVRKEKT